MKTTEQIDNEILNLAEKIESLMKDKGYIDDSEGYGMSPLSINSWHDGTIEVESQLQGIKTIRRKKK